MIKLEEAEEVIVDALHEYISLYQQRIKNYPYDNEWDKKELKLAMGTLTAFGKRFKVVEVEE